jgi:hypothetical protein
MNAIVGRETYLECCHIQHAIRPHTKDIAHVFARACSQGKEIKESSKARRLGGAGGVHGAGSVQGGALVVSQGPLIQPKVSKEHDSIQVSSSRPWAARSQ